MELQQFTKRIPQLVKKEFKYKFLPTRAYNPNYGNVRMFKEDLEQGSIHLIVIDNVVYVIPLKHIRFIPPHKDFTKEAAIIKFETLVPFNDSFHEGQAREFKKDEFSTHTGFLEIAKNIGDLLEYKNKKYGNSALAPLNIFSGKTKVGGRLDDKLARIKNSNSLQKNDVADVLGYLMLVCKENQWTTFDEFKD